MPALFHYAAINIQKWQTVRGLRGIGSRKGGHMAGLRYGMGERRHEAMLKKALYWRQYHYFGQRPNKVPFPKCNHSQCVHSENRILPKKARRKVFIVTVLQR